MLAGGTTRAEILHDYPYLQDDDITAALEFASRATDHPVLAAPELAERTRIGLNSKQWPAFMAALDAPPQRHPRMERLLKEPGILD